MAIIFFRAVILLVTLLFVMRLMGKRQIGEMQPFEFIITLLIAELACVPMADVSIPLLYGIISVLAVFILHQLLTVLEQSSDKLRHVISGKPSVVINLDGVDVKELRRNNMGVDDLIESMRNTGNFSLDSVFYAVYEANGKLSVLKNEQKTNQKLPLLIVSEGKINFKNLELAHLEKDFAEKLAKENGEKTKNVEVLTLDGDGNVYFKAKNKPYKTFNVTLAEETQKW